ncbi:HTTM domain-containing protein [Haladaptatus sp. QDMS2]|uniref:HTTM domain-containing protein n=1 Tax=Haladaptatus sp. QDMS2 TaxID=3033391 RepID=UPI0023E84660|nr:HTTM domain-containing protein [Haladaptatus sp. QDMS2]
MALHNRLSTVRDRISLAVRHRFEIDTRSLAVFRIAIGLLILADLVRRSRALTAFYTDFGVLPRTALISRSDPLHLSLHTLSGDAWVQAVFFLIAGVFAVALTIGYRTSAATIGSWIFLVSLHNRMPEVLNGGDFLLRLLLFWAMFLPLGASWAVDNQQASNTQTRTAVRSVAAAALLLQVVIMYSTNAAFKLSGDVWLQGKGLEYVFSLGQFTILFGDVLGSYPAVLHGLDYLWLGMITLSFLLIALPGLWRTGFVFLFISLHLGMLFTMRIDLFALISIAGLLPFLPAAFWDIVLPQLSHYRLSRAIGQWPQKLAGTLPVITVSGVPSLLSRWKTRLGTGVPLFFLVLIVLWNIQVLGYSQVYGHDVVPEEAESVIDLTRTDQYWNMFAPDPLSTDGWIVAPGLLENGSRIDAFHGGPIRWDRPADISDTYPTARWRKYLVGLWRDDTTDRRYFADYLCRRWNSQHEAELVNVSVYFMEQPTQIHTETEPINKVKLEDYHC